jgi:hypothetical protein
VKNEIEAGPSRAQSELSPIMTVYYTFHIQVMGLYYCEGIHV